MTQITLNTAAARGVTPGVHPSKVDPRPLRVLIHRTGSMGDTLIAFAALRLIQAAFPNSTRILLGNAPAHTAASPAVTVLEGSGLIHAVYYYPAGGGLKALYAAWKGVRKIKPDVVVSLSSKHDERSAARDWLMFRLAGVKRVIGLDPGDRALKRLPDEPDLHEQEAERLVRTIRELGTVDLQEPESWALLPHAADVEGISAACPEWTWPGDYIVLATGTKQPANDWGQERWKEAIKDFAEMQLKTGMPLRMVCVGAAEDAERAEELGQIWREYSANRYYNFCGKLTVLQTAALMTRARLMLGHDSGPMHLAAASGTKVVAVFSRRNRLGQWFPLGHGHALLFSDVPCAGCGLTACVEKANLCTRQIPAAEVANQAMIRLHET